MVSRLIASDLLPMRTPPRMLLILLLVTALLLSGCGGALSPDTQGSQRTPTAGSLLPPEAPAPTAMPAIQEPRLLSLEWPARLRVGDSDTIRLTLEVDETGSITPTALIEGHETRGERVLIPNLYDTHTVMVEARLDIAGLTYTPTSEVIESLLPGQSVKFFWSIKPQEVGRYRGTIWLHLHYLPKEPDGQEARLALSAQLVEIEAVNFLGLGGGAARVTGWLGAALGSILGLDKLFDLAVGLFKRQRRKTPPQTG
jgi:hypothetical protein